MLWLDDSYQPLLEQLGLASLSALRTRFISGTVPTRKTVDVRPHDLAAPDGSRLAVFVKHYAYPSPSWAFLGRTSKARCEYQNYGIFKALGIPCADRIACAEWRDLWGRLEGALIVTRAIPEAVTLIDFWEAHCVASGTAASRPLRASLRHQLASMTRRIHASGFYHHDLVWRNVLVTWQPPAEPKLWWIDCPRGAVRRLPFGCRRRQLKDLALLDKRGSRHASRSERMAFVLEYLGQSRIDPVAKRLVRDTLAYNERRWRSCS